MRLIPCLLAILFLCGFQDAGDTGQSATQGQRVYHLSAQDSRVLFEVRKLGFMKERGRFDTVDATLRTDGEADPVRLHATIAIASVAVNSDSLKSRLMSADWFDVENHPDTHFTCDDVRITGTTSAVAEGVLTMRGITRPETFSISFDTDIARALQAGNAFSFTARGSIDRTRYGMTRLGGLVSEDIEMTFAGRFVPAETAATASPR